MRYAKIVVRPDGAMLSDLFEVYRQYPLDNSSDNQAGSIVQYSICGSAVEINAVVAHAGTALASIWDALSEQGVYPEFPAAVEAEVQTIVEDPGIEDTTLPDQSHLPFVTIDNVDSKDLDQAMHISQSDSGFTLHYALADAAYFVKPGSELFREALRRGASYYVPGFAVPMLPRALSEGLVSLNEQVSRRALVFTICFDQQGQVYSTEVEQARIRSAAKLSYRAVQSYYDHPSESPLGHQAYASTLDALRALGLLRIEEARRRNVVEYDRSSVEISLTKDETGFVITDTDRLAVERYNEQISLVCNAEGARLLEAAGVNSVVQAVFRIHDAPDTERLVKFSRLLRGLIRHYQLSEALWVWRWRDGKFGKREYLSDYLKRLKDNNVDAGLLAAVQRHALMLSPASRFSAEPGVHHSLRLDQYARFSSPMREIAGIYTHREYLQYASVETLEDSNDEDLRSAVIDAANRSKEIQKKLNKAVLKKAIDQLFEQQLSLPVAQRQRWRGTVLSLRSTRVYVRLDTPSIVVKIYLKKLQHLSGSKFELDRSSAVIRGDDGSVFALGQRVELTVHEYSDKRWSLMPV